VLGADVGGHDHDRVAEVDGTSLRVGQAPVVEQLQQCVEHVRVGLLHLVEQHHAVRLAAYRLGQLTALVVADVAGRGADEPGDGVPFLILAHVQADHVVLGVEQRRREGLGEFGLADAAGAQEQERADRPARVLHPGAGPDDRVGDKLDGFVLADDAFVHDLLDLFPQSRRPRRPGRWPCPAGTGR
jgi:hypothetical protein